MLIHSKLNRSKWIVWRAMTNVCAYVITSTVETQSSFVTPKCSLGNCASVPSHPYPWPEEPLTRSLWQGLVLPFLESSMNGMMHCAPCLPGFFHFVQRFWDSLCCCVYHTLYSFSSLSSISLYRYTRFYKFVCHLNPIWGGFQILTIIINFYEYSYTSLCVAYIFIFI